MTPVGIRKVTVTGLLVLTTTVAVGCGGAAGPSDEAVLRPSAEPTSPMDGAPEASDDAALPSDDGDGAGPVGGTTNGTIGEGGGTGGTGGAGTLPEGTPLPDSNDGPVASDDPSDPFGPAEATYHRGVASLTTGSTIHRLTRLAGPGTYFHEFGSDVVWTSGDGWYLQVGGAKPNSDQATLPAYIAIDWVHDGQHWVTWDPSGCDITIDKADKSGLAGTAKCKDMRWVDAIVAGLADEPTPVVGQAAFSVRIEFQAAP